MGSVTGTVASINALLLRPFQQQVDIVTVALLLVLLLALAGQWHIVIERVEA